MPIAAYLVTAVYLWSIGAPDSWKRAFGPVLTVSSFIIVGPAVRNWWFRRERQKLLTMIPEEEETN